MRELSFRIPVLAMAVLAATLAVAVFAVYEWVLVDGRGDLDEILLRERGRFAQSIDGLLDEQPPVPADATAEEAADARSARVLAAARRYLQLNPAGNEFYVTVVTVGDSVLRAAGGPPELAALLDDGSLRLASTGRLETIQTDAGGVRVLGTPIEQDEQTVGTFHVLGALAPVGADAVEAAGQMLVGALITMLVGGLGLALVLRKSLLPLRALSSTAQSTELADLSSRVAEPEREDEVGRLAREFNRMLARLERTAAERQEFMATVSHELRTPVTIARGHIEVLEATAGKDLDADAQAVRIVREELGRMSRLVDDLMSIARSEAEDFVAPAPVDLLKLFTDLELRLVGLGLADAAVLPPPRVEVTVDRDRIVQALLNLAVNADVHTPDGTMITVSATVEDGVVRFAVADDGPGIDPAIRSQVLEPFVKTEDHGASTGLGLAVVAAIAEAHGGTVQVETAATGTRVAICIPL